MTNEKTLTELAKEFQFYILWNEHREYGKCKLDVEKTEDVFLAVRKAYIDMMPRTIDGLGLSFLDKISTKGKSKNEKKEIKEKKKECLDCKYNLIYGEKGVLHKLAEEIAEVMRIKVFKHDELCENFEKNYKTAISEINNKCEELFGKEIPKEEREINEEEIKYGKAQKIVNMTFKYLTLFDNAGHSKYNKIFKACHMPVDSIVIDYFKGKGVMSDMTWSKLTKPEYEDLQGKDGKIRKYCEEKLTGDLLYDEFSIWREMQMSRREAKID